MKSALETTPARPNISPALANSILLGFTLLFLVFAFEVALRIVFWHSLDFSMEMWKYAVALKRPAPDPRLSFSHLPNGHAFLMGADVDINSQGLRDKEYSLAKPPGTFRIMILGDSTAFGWGVKAQDTSAKILEEQLNRSGLPGYRHVEVINTGVGNYDTVQEVTYYQTRGKAFHPDLVILEYFINDAEPVPQEKKGVLIDRSYLVAFLRSRFDSVLRLTGTRPDWKQYYASLYGDDRPGFIAAKNALQDLVSAARADGSQVLVAILPELHQINNGTYPFQAEHQKIRNTLEPLNAPVIDLIEGLQGHGPEESLWVTRTDDHPNRKANTLIAEQMERWIRLRM